MRLRNESPFAGATVVNLSPAVAEDFGLHIVKDGVVVSEVEDGSNAADTGLQKGDVILQLNASKIASTKAMERATASGASSWRIMLVRAGQTISTEIGG